MGGRDFLAALPERPLGDFHHVPDEAAYGVLLAFLGARHPVQCHEMRVRHADVLAQAQILPNQVVVEDVCISSAFVKEHVRALLQHGVFAFSLWRISVVV